MCLPKCLKSLVSESLLAVNVLKLNLHHEYFPDTSEKYINFPMFALPFGVSYVSMERLHAAKFAAPLFTSTLFSLLQSLNRLLFKRLI